MTIFIELAKANYTEGYFFNIEMQYTNYIAADGITAKIQLGKGGKTIEARINRTYNTDGTPRIMAGKEYRYWVQENYKFGNHMKVEIVNSTSLILHRKGEKL